MHITFESRHADGNQLRNLSVERVRFALRNLQRSQKPVRGHTARLAFDG